MKEYFNCRTPAVWAETCRKDTFIRQPWYIKILSGIVFMLVLLFHFTASVSAEEERQVIRVGSFPFEEQLLIDSSGNYSGYGFDYLQEIARYTGWQYEFVDCTWQESLDLLKTGEIDLAGAIMKSREREAIYDFSDYPMLSGYGVLVTRLDNSILPYEDFEAFDGLRVGALEDNLQTANFILYSQVSGFRPELSYYPDQGALEAAMKNGEIEGAVLSNILRSQELRVIAKFGENDSYFATTKGNKEILEQLNNAMSQIKLNNPYYNSDLNQEYYNLQAATPISFNREELTYIQNSGPIKCVYDPELAPISYFDKKTGEFCGIAADICKLLEENTGLVFEYIHCATWKEAMDAFNSGEADLMLTQNHDLSWAQKNKSYLTTPYFEGQTILVTNDHYSPGGPVGLSESVNHNKIVSGFIEEAGSVQYYPNVSACLDQVRKGKIDATLVNSAVMNYQINNPKYSNLTTAPIYGYSENTSIAVSIKADSLLLLILNKGLGNLSTAQMNHIINTNISIDQYNSLISYIYKNPLEALLVVGCSLLLLAIILIMLYRSRIKSANAMKKMLYTDSLTGYPSYKALVDESIRLIEKAPEKYALIYMDMHQFKSINDTFGYDAGDRVLKEISDTLHEIIGKDERFARVYADKFVLLLQYISESDFEGRIKELSKRLEMLSSGEFATASFLFSGGIYHLQGDFGNLDHACDRANYAKCSVKEHFVNTFVYYDDILRSQIMNEKILEYSMVPALENNEFVPFYQPKVNVITGELVGAEALVRWQHPEQGILPPGIFLPFYEKNGFIVKIDFAVFEMVVRDLKAWMDMGSDPIHISVNFSRRHMQNKHFARKLKDIVDRYGVPTRFLEIEITETVELESVELAVEFVNEIKSYGFTVSIDDFGVGYSSLSFLQELPLDVLKLDKKFLENAMIIPKARDIMRHLVTAMKSNGIQIICEGVESREQQEFIISLNCCFAQGFLYSRPLSHKDFQEYLLKAKVASPQTIDLMPITGFMQKIWSGSEDFLDRVMPGWIMGCYLEEGFPIFYISPGFLGGLGYSELEFQSVYYGQHVRCIHPEDYPKVIRQIYEQIEEGDEISVQYRMLKKDGNYLWIRDVGKRILTDEGREAILSVCTDVTDIVSLQQEKSMLIDTIPGGVAQISVSGTELVIQEATDRFFDVLGYSREEMEVRGNCLLPVIYEKDQEAIRKKQPNIIGMENGRWRFSLRIRQPDNCLRWISIMGTVHDTSEGKMATVIGYDIDDEMRSRQQAEVVKAKLELMLMLTNHAIFEYDILNKTIKENSGLDIFGYKNSRTGDIPAHILDCGYIHPDDVHLVEEAFKQVGEGEPNVTVEARIKMFTQQEGTHFVWTRTTFNTIHEENGQPEKAVGFVENIDVRKRYEYAFVQEEQYRRAVAESSLLAYDVNLTHDVISKITGNTSSRFLDVYQSMSQPGRYTEMIETALETMVAQQDRERYRFEMSRSNLLFLFQNGTTEKEYEYRRLMPDGQELWVSAVIHLLSDKTSRDVLCFAYYKDIQVRKEKEKSLAYKAERDSLTGLLNRDSMEQMVRDILLTDLDKEIHGFLMIDVDSFKKVNDSYGHQFGDEYLIRLGKCICENIRESDIISRLGGDEFAVLLKSIHSEEAAVEIAQVLVEEITLLGEEMPHIIRSSASIGIAFAPRQGITFAQLYRCADEAMYRAKRDPDVNIAVYEER